MSSDSETPTSAAASALGALPRGTPELLKKIDDWRNDDRQGYDVAIELLCEAEAHLGALQIALDQKERELETARTSVFNVPFAAGLMTKLKEECEKQHARAEQAEAALDAERTKGERVFQAVVYAYEGKEDQIPADLKEHGFVKRGRKHFDAERTTQQALNALVSTWRETAKQLREGPHQEWFSQGPLMTANWLDKAAGELDVALQARRGPQETA